MLNRNLTCQSFVREKGEEEDIHLPLETRIGYLNVTLVTGQPETTIGGMGSSVHAVMTTGTEHGLHLNLTLYTTTFTLGLMTKLLVKKITFTATVQTLWIPA